MDNQYQYQYTTTPEERQRRREERIAARKVRERARRKKMLLRLIAIAVLVAAVVGILFLALGRNSGNNTEDPPPVQTDPSPAPPEEEEPQKPEEPAPPYNVSATASTATIGGELPSQYAVLIDLNSDTILAQKGADTVINPASMTKIMTVLVAAEAIKDKSQLEDTVTIDLEITDYCFTNDCSVAGFFLDEAVPVRDLFYGTILPSGAEAAIALARYIAGSHEEFVVMMNEKAKELGLSSSAHFTNCVGLYDEEIVCTVRDMALIMKAALENDLSREALTTNIYEIPANDFHVEGMILSNWFLRRIEDHIGEGITVKGAKTGYVSQAGSCAASYAENTAGGRFICVTADSTSSWQCIRDHVQLYDRFAGVD